jgi:hypothetical protein
MYQSANRIKFPLVIMIIRVPRLFLFFLIDIDIGVDFSIFKKFTESENETLDGLHSGC